MRTNASVLTDEAADLNSDALEWQAGVRGDPLPFEHNLHRLDLFAPDSLRALTAKYGERDSFVAASAPTPGTEFYAVPNGSLAPSRALEQLDSSGLRLLLKRPERYDARFKALLDALFAKVVEQRGGLGRERVVRLESGIFMSSAEAVTPFHFDPEMTFFFQIEGEKVYHVFSPSSLGEPELERFYVKGIVNIGQTNFARRDLAAESIFNLFPGDGFYQPQNAPHWVQTRSSRSISYAFSFETDAMRAANRTRSFNYYQRRLGMHPAAPGLHPAVDAAKASAMSAVIPARKALGKVARSASAALNR